MPSSATVPIFSIPISRASNQFYALFVASVAAGRPRLTEDAIRATEARTFLGEEAVKLGLADAIGSLEEALAGPGQARRHPTTERTAMTETTAPAAEAPADNEAKLSDAREAGMRKGAAAERERIKAIPGSGAAKGRTALAKHLAYETDWSAAAATAMLEKAPQEAAKETKPDYVARKEAAGTLGLGLPPAQGPGGREPPRLSNAEIYAGRRAAR